MFHNRKSNNHINHIHERALRIVSQDHNSTFDELLAKDGSFKKIHDHNLQKSLIEIFKFKMKFAPENMNEVFSIKECPYLLRNPVKSTFRESVTYKVLINICS